MPRIARNWRATDFETCAPESAVGLLEMLKVMTTAKIILDKRAVKDGQPAPIKLSICHERRTTLLSLNIQVLPSQWDAQTGRVVKHPNQASINAYLGAKRAEVEKILIALCDDELITGMRACDVRDYVAERILPMKAEEKRAAEREAAEAAMPRVHDYFERYKQYKDIRDSTKEKYDVAWRRIVAWLGEERAANLRFTDITYGWIEDFDRFMMQTAPKGNSRHNHHATLKAVINYARRMEVTDRNPYENFEMPSNPTDKRNMSAECLRRIFFAKLRPSLVKYRDFFMLSFLLRGLNTVDLCHLSKPLDGRVEWQRTKTGQPISLKIEPEMQEIIDRYAGENLMLDICDKGVPYRAFDRKCNIGLHKIAEYLNSTRKKNDPVIPDFTMYWARHSWATIALSIDVPFDTVKSGLAHSQNSVTDIYIERDPEKVDRANRQVLDYVLYGKNPQESALMEMLKRMGLKAVPIEDAPKRRGRPKKSDKVG